MAKCIMCGMSTAVRGQVDLDGGEICEPCFKELGFRASEAPFMKEVSFFDIKDGAEAYDRKKAGK